MRLENLFYDVTSSLRYTLKGYSNCKFRIFNGKISLQKFTKSVPQGSNIINHISLSLLKSVKQKFTPYPKYLAF